MTVDINFIKKIIWGFIQTFLVVTSLFWQLSKIFPRCQSVPTRWRTKSAQKRIFFSLNYGNAIQKDSALHPHCIPCWLNNSFVLSLSILLNTNQNLVELILPSRLWFFKNFRAHTFVFKLILYENRLKLFDRYKDLVQPFHIFNERRKEKNLYVSKQHLVQLSVLTLLFLAIYLK